MATHAGRVNNILRKMWKRRSASLLRDLGVKKPGPIPTFSRRYREAQIKSIQLIVYRSMRKELKSWVKNTTTRRSVFLNGIAGGQKWEVLRNRLHRYEKQRNLVYVFWRGKKCLKVGRSEIGLKRIEQQKGSALFQKARRVVVFFPSGGLKRSVPALECALTHLYNIEPPIKPSKKKWRERCPLCKKRSWVKKKIRAWFPL